MKYDFLTLSRPRSRALEDPNKETKKNDNAKFTKKMDFCLDGVFEDFNARKRSFEFSLDITFVF